MSVLPVRSLASLLCPNPLTVASQTPLPNLLAQMGQLPTDYALVVEDQRILGGLCIQDVVRAMAVHPATPGTTPEPTVAIALSSHWPVLYLSDLADLTLVLPHFQQGQRPVLLVCCDAQRGLVEDNLVGLLTYTDVLSALVAEKPWAFRLSPDELEAMIRSSWLDVLAGNPSRREYRLVNTDGSLRWMCSTVIPHYSAQGDWTVTATTVEITEQKSVEEALHSSEELFRAVFEQAGMGIAIVGPPHYRLDSTNPALQQMLGYTAEELAQIDYQAITYPEDIPLEIPLVEEMRQGRRDHYTLEKRYIRKDGQLLWIRLTATVIRYGSGQTRLAIALVEDIHDRKQAEILLQASLREKESLLSEIHHRVKNNLQIVSSLLSLQALRVQDPGIQRVLEDSWTRVDSMALVHESLYRTRNFAAVAFDEYLQRLISNLFQIYSTSDSPLHLTLEVPEQMTLTLDQSIPCGLIVNELVTNALKHGVAETPMGEIRVSLVVDSDQAATLTVSNTGDRLPLTFDLADLTSMGLQLVQNLVEQLDGQLEVRRGDLTQFIVHFPLQNDPDASVS